MPKREPFRIDHARENMLRWKHEDPERWAMLQPAMRAVLEDYAAAKAAALDFIGPPPALVTPWVPAAGDPAMQEGR